MRPTVDRYATDSWPTYHQQLTDITPTYDRYSVEVRWRSIDRYSGDTLSLCRPNIDRLSTNSGPTLDGLSVDSRPTVDRLTIVYRSTIDRYIDRIIKQITPRPWHHWSVRLSGEIHWTAGKRQSDNIRKQTAEFRIERYTKTDPFHPLGSTCDNKLFLLYF